VSSVFSTYYAQQAGQRQSAPVPTTSDYIQAIRNSFATFPNICSVGVTARFSATGGKASVGVDLNSNKGVRFAGGYRIAELGPGQGSVSFKGSSVSASVSVRIPDTPFSVGASVQGNEITSANVGLRLNSNNTIQAYGSVNSFYNCGGH
jgi:hypothetical protein